MTYAGFCRVIAGAVAVFIAIVATLNVAIDPYGVFGSQWLAKPLDPNERYLKIEHLCQVPEQHDAFMFGSSRVGTTQPEVIRRYRPSLQPYNMSFLQAGLLELRDNIRFLANSKFPLRLVYLELDVEHLLTRLRPEPNNWLAKPHPLISGQPMPAFFFGYLTICPFEKFLEKLTLNATSRIYRDYDIAVTGCWYAPALEAAARRDPEAFVAQVPDFHGIGRREMRGEATREALTAVGEIRDDVARRGAELVVFVTPHHHKSMDRFVLADYHAALDGLAYVVPYWDFSGYNVVTNDDRNYYEINHYRPHVGAWIAARVFGGKEAPVGFGTYRPRRKGP